MLMNNKPNKTKEFQLSNICFNCAWSIGSSENGREYYCYYFDKTFDWEYEKNHKVGVRLKMTSCTVFHSIPSDMKRGSEFAKFFQNKMQIESSSTRSWISIGIASAALAVSIILNDWIRSVILKIWNYFAH